MYRIEQTLIRVSEHPDAQIHSAKEAIAVIMANGYPAVETMLAIYLDGKHKVQAIHTVSVGTLNTTICHPRDVFGPAFRLGTVAAVILAHNHPSGDCSPSAEDVALTRRIKECGEILGLPLVDHIVFSDKEHYSFAQEGRL